MAVELTTLNPVTGQPAIDHIRAAFARACTWSRPIKAPSPTLMRTCATRPARRKLLFRFEATVMDGAPVFNQVRNNLPGVTVLGFTGVLNSTSKIVIETMEQGGTFEEGLDAARRMGIAEADASYDVEGWDSAAKTAALANVLMDARTKPQAISTRGITRLTPERVQELNAQRQDRAPGQPRQTPANRRPLAARARRGAGQDRSPGLGSRHVEPAAPATPT